MTDPQSVHFSPEEWFKAKAQAQTVLSTECPDKRLGVAFQGLGVYGYKTSTDYQQTLGNLLTALFNKLIRKAKIKTQILHTLDGLVRSGETLVVLGRPGSGCTTLLKTLAGVTHGVYIDETSQISYQGNTPHSSCSWC